MFALAGCANHRISAPVDTVTPLAQVTALVVLTQPAGTAPSGMVFSRQPVVQLRDAANAPVHQSGVIVAATVAAGGGVLGGTTIVVTDASGTAAFSDLAIAGAVGARTLAFSANSLRVTSAPVAITAGAPAKLAVVIQPSAAARSGDTIAQGPVVQLLDAWDNVVTARGISVSASIASGSAKLTGTTTAPTDTNGRAIFPNLVLTGAGTQTLRFTAVGLTPATSGAITITAGGGGDTATAAMLVSESFDDVNLAARGWYDLPDAPASISATEHVPGSAGALQVSFTPGATVPSPLIVARHLFTPTQSVYVRFWVKHSANWVGSGHTYHPHELYFLTTEDDAYVGPSSTHLTAYVEENARADGGYGVLQVQDAKNIDVGHLRQDLTGATENRAIAGCNGNTDGMGTDCYSSAGAWYNGKWWLSARPAFLDAPGSGYKGDWHKIEAFFQLNTIVNGIGQRDGVAQYWVDGQLEIDRHDLMFRTGAHPTMQFNQLLIGPYIGDGSPVAQALWIDELAIMTARPAP